VRRVTRIAIAVYLAFLSMIISLPCFGQPFATPSAFQTQVDGSIIFAATWNSTIGGLYTYLNTVLLPQLNVPTTKGDLYVYNGTLLARLGAGSNGQVLTADSTQTLGLKWAAGAGLPITTKGDLIVGNGSGVAARLPIGVDSKVLTADSSQTNGLGWASVVNLNPPAGAIILWYGPYGGAVPVGWHLCDGTNGTPNMIGLVPIGAQTAGGSATANASGYGNTIENTIYGSTTHTHTVSIGGSTGQPSAGTNIGAGTIGSVNIATGTHTHSFSASGTTGSASTQPASMGLQFIMKL